MERVEHLLTLIKSRAVTVDIEAFQLGYLMSFVAGLARDIPEVRDAIEQRIAMNTKAG